MADTSDIANATITTREACQLLGVSKAWLRAIAGQGYFEKAGTNAWPLAGVVQGYLRYLQDQNRRAVKSAADGRVADLRAADLEERTRIRAAALIGRDESTDAIRQIIATVREPTAGAGARITTDVAMAATIDAGLAEICDRADAKLDHAAEALRNGSTLSRAGRPWNS